MANKNIRDRNRRFVADYKTRNPCAICGKHFPAAVMDFHHVDASEKEACISNAVNKEWSIARLEQEISKCLLVCANDHRLLHARIEG